MIKAYKYKLRLTVKQEKFLAQVFGCTRFIYNWGLEKKMKSYADTKKSLSYTPLAAMLTELKKTEEHRWLNDVPNVCLQQSLRCLESAYTKFIVEKKGRPKFKSKRGSKPCAKYVENVDFDFENWKVKIPKMGWVNICHNRGFGVADVKLGTLTVTKDKCGDY
ncbi:MAG: helix-turn-helix domain-containing protein, partial [Bacteroidales bacterium]|nr:helix-turn-helix domain-containing protein [Bacteroidales bacterium]